MARLTFQKAGLLSPKTLRNEIVQNVDQMSDIQTGDGRYASAASVFPAVDLDAPTEAYFVVGGAAGPMSHTPAAAESPIGGMGDIEERDITTKTYKRKRAPEKEVDTKLNSERQIISLYQWAASRHRLELFLTREQVCWRGDEVTDGLIGLDGNTPHPDIPTQRNVINPATQYSDTAASTPYRDISYSSFLLDDGNQGFMDGQPTGTPTMFVSPSVWHDLKLNEDMGDRFTGVEVRGLTDEQVRNLVDSEIPNVRIVRVDVPRRNADGDYVDEDGNVVENLDDPDADPAMDNVLEPWDPSADAGAGRNRRNVVIGTPGANSAFLPYFTDNLGGFDDPGAPRMQSGFSVDSSRGFMTQTWIGNDPAVTWLKALQDVGFHIQLPEQWVILRDV